jgi:selenocysteine-specific translation elongation factor
MVKDAAGRIDRLTVDKIEELAQGVQARLDEFEQMKAGVDLAQLRNDVADLRERVNDLELKKGK